MGRHGPEKSVEQSVVTGAERRGGLALKMNPRWYAGIPDRLVLLPRKRMYFVETKAPEGKVSKIQGFVHNLLNSIGFRVYVPASVEEVKEMFREWDAA